METIPLFARKNDCDRERALRDRLDETAARYENELSENELSENAQDEMRLMKDVADGRVGALERLLDGHQADVRRMVGRLTAWGNDVDDLTQEVFLKAWRAARSFDGRGALRSWLLSIAVRQCRNHHRSAARWLNTLTRFAQWRRDHGENDASSETKHGVDDRLVDDARWLAMQRALGQLSTRDRELLVLMVMEQQPAAAIATLLGISTDTLYVRLHRAKTRLTKLLK